jgi:signal transduction histidine kinase
MDLKKRRLHLKAQQVMFVLIAFAGGTTGLIDYIIKYRISIYPFGYVSALFFISVIAFAILHGRLMDIEFVIKKGLIYSALTAVITAIFISSILVFERLFIGVNGYGSLWVGIFVAFVISIVFQPLREGVHDLVDRYFFRARYDYQKILNKYSHALAQPMVNLDRFSRLAPYLLTKSMKLSGASVAVLDRDTHVYIVRAGERNARELEGMDIPDNSALMREILAKKKEVSLEEIESRLKNENLPESEREKLIKIAEEMKRIRTALAIPCISESNYFQKPTLLSTINLGEKLSEESFSGEDISFLDTLANQATISIEYAFIIEELKRQQEAVVRSEKLAVIGTTTAGVAHELKNPLTYLSAVAQVLPKKWDDPEFKRSVGEMLPSEIQRMQLIIEGLLDYSRTRELMLKPLDIKSVTEKAIALLAYEIKKNKVYVKTDYNHHQKANGDPNRLMQVFMNIMSNAVQAMEKGGDLYIMTMDSDEGVRVAVSDTGPGIPEDKLKRIFDPFFTTKEGGTGLGLPISKRIIDEHEGQLSVTSTPGQGTTFTVSLPAAS